MSILVVGSIAYDSVETPFGKRENALGGSTIYFSSAAGLFAPVNIVGVVGDDFNHDDIAFLEDRQVNFDGMHRAEGKTFRWGGKYHANMNKRDTLFTDLNVFESFKPEIPRSHRDPRYLFLANIDPDLQLEVLSQVNKPQLVVLDTMNLWIDIKRDSLEKVVRKSDILILNDEELVDFSGEANLVKAVRKVSAMGPESIVVKRGEYGALLYSGEHFFFTPAFPLERVVDPTGAGDTFAGGFLGHVASQDKHDAATLREAIVYGSVTASFTVEDFSMERLKSLDQGQIDKRYEVMRKMVKI